jgi:DNA-directed RNA polymerase subunit beta'
MFNLPVEFNKISICLASNEFIIKKSCGEVLKPETINYRTLKPERDGLFCERIFGPINDYECACGKYKNIRYKGITCDKCGVAVVENKVRRERIGHIHLVVPIVHIWYFRSLPNKIGILLGLSSQILERIIYYERYVVIQPGIAQNIVGSTINQFDIITEEEYLHIKSKLPKGNENLDDNNPNKFIAKIGAECIEYLLNTINLDDIYDELKLLYYYYKDKPIYKKEIIDPLKRLHIVADFIEAEKYKQLNKEWMIVHVIPVIPPELRPIIPLDGGKFATSDINELYRRIIIRNNRLKKLIEIQAPEIIIRHEKRMLQEAVDAIYVNNEDEENENKEENNKKSYEDSGKRILKSLSDSLIGKKGRFRLNLLGKRVDYSARSVIVVGPNLKLYECGLPKYIALELYKPFIIRKLLDIGIVQTVKHAKKILTKKHRIIWKILANIIKGHPILLNRAPTLHRLGIQAFQPKLIEGKSIKLHPLVCTAFNADFDGDQMAVHLPLSHEAILEAQLLMLSSQNLLNPANGYPITVPSQDMVLGLYYITKDLKYNKINNKIIFSSFEEVEIAYNQKLVEIHDKIKIQVNLFEDNYTYEKIIETTVGRVLFNKFIPPKVGYINELITKKKLSDIIKKILTYTDVTTTVNFLDSIKELGFENSFKGGLSFNLDDLFQSVNKDEIILKSIKKHYQLKNNYNKGLINNHHRYNSLIDIWTNTNKVLTKKFMNKMFTDHNEFNSITMMLDSGARGSKEQIRQISVMRGLMTRHKKKSVEGEIIETPIISNFKDGISILEYFISTHGARKGLADTALKTADAGYLTRRLVDVAQDIIIQEKDCGTIRGIYIHSVIQSNYDIGYSFYRCILGRIASQNVSKIQDNQIIVYYKNMIEEQSASEIDKIGIEQVYVRSPITCESKDGICAKCYGMNMAKGDIVQKGEAVGVTAAQSIGEPGTQLTLRTFHVGGTLGKIYESLTQFITQFNGIVEYDKIQFIKFNDQKLVISKYSSVKIIHPVYGFIWSSYSIPSGSILLVNNGEFINTGTKLGIITVYNYLIISDYSGIVNYNKIISNKILFTNLIFLNYNGIIQNIYYINIGYTLTVSEGEYIKKGCILALQNIKKSEKKTMNLTVGLPRVTELFEARNPSNQCILSEIDGIVHFFTRKNGKIEIFIVSPHGKTKRYIVPKYNKIIVHKKESIKAGTALSDGPINPKDILYIKGSYALKEFLITEIQEVYSLQGVTINDKHLEIILRQMMRKVKIINSGDTKFLPNSIEYKEDFIQENQILRNFLIIEDIGDSNKYELGQIISILEYQLENDILFAANKVVMKCRYVNPAIGKPILQGITKASLQKKSFISSASFQETTKVLNEAAIFGKTDDLIGLKENVVVGNKIPAGTGFEEYNDFWIF